MFGGLKESVLVDSLEGTKGHHLWPLYEMEL